MLRVQLFIASGCPHCPNVLLALSELIKDGEIAELEVSNIALMPEKAQAFNVRSVPWVKIGPFELTGLQTKGELYEWITRLQSSTGMQDYFTELLTTGELNKVITLLKKDHDLFNHLPPMIANKEVPLGAKIGIGAIFEEFQGCVEIETLIPALTHLLTSEQASVRHDVCHYLGLTESPKALDAVKTVLDDEDEAVRETAHEVLLMLNEGIQNG